MKKYAIGLDYGTNSCRALIVDLSDGFEVASSLYNYPSGEAGVLKILMQCAGFGKTILVSAKQSKSRN